MCKLYYALKIDYWVFCFLDACPDGDPVLSRLFWFGLGDCPPCLGDCPPCLGDCPLGDCPPCLGAPPLGDCPACLGGFESPTGFAAVGLGDCPSFGGCGFASIGFESPTGFATGCPLVQVYFCFFYLSVPLVVLPSVVVALHLLLVLLVEMF